MALSAFGFSVHGAGPVIVGHDRAEWCAALSLLPRRI